MEPFANLEQFLGNHPIHEFALNFISKAALSEIKNGNGKLFFNYIIDGFLNKLFFLYFFIIPSL